jgi:TniQ
VSPPRRWPLHPQPGPLESLSSWLERTARLYDLTVKDLLTCNLGQPGVTVPEFIDEDPPAEMLAALAERTGTDLAQLRAMTLAGWVPWLLDTHTRPREAQEMFDTYVRQDSVLLAPGEAGRDQVQVSGRRSWSGPWQAAYPVARLCPACAAEPDPRRALVWQLPLTVSCLDHGCRLQAAREIAPGGGALKPVPAGEPLATLDRYTHEALITGQVTLPGRSVHAGVWFRLLRSLLDEVSLAFTTRSAHGRATLERVWQETGRPGPGGLAVWQPYEQMHWPTQEAMLHGAATALQLAVGGQITARGTLGSAVQPSPHRHVYDGDQPSPHRSAWQEAMAEISAAVTLARTDRDAARQLLVLLTLGCRTLDRFEEKRAYLFGIGIPPDSFLAPVSSATATSPDPHPRAGHS